MVSSLTLAPAAAGQDSTTNCQQLVHVSKGGKHAVSKSGHGSGTS